MKKIYFCVIVEASTGNGNLRVNLGPRDWKPERVHVERLNLSLQAPITPSESGASGFHSRVRRACESRFEIDFCFFV